MKYLVGTSEDPFPLLPPPTSKKLCLFVKLGTKPVHLMKKKSYTIELSMKKINKFKGAHKKKINKRTIKRNFGDVRRNSTYLPLELATKGVNSLFTNN